MLSIQNLSQISALNSLTAKAQNRFATPVKNNSLERSPMSDSVNFTGKKDDKIYTPEELNAEIYDFDELPEAEVFEVVPDDVEDDCVDAIEVYPASIAEDDEDDACRVAILQDEQDSILKAREEEEERKKREFENDMLVNDAIMYGVVLPELVVAPIIADDVPENNDFSNFDDDFSSFDDGFGF